ncbi:polysaccharide export protein [Lophiotrema nucula]|uniref:Polysaccharide export protein n=1 Tax=Lophiotrema nucula TaxID=690887 RepID=A0A6A5ZFF3_9PLEO|nr:polysaccharide export protein [Lophiotrema nucula]
MPCRRTASESVLVVVAIALFLTYDTFDVSFSGRPPYRVPSTSAYSKRERIFIGSIHWNNEAILRSHWNKAVVDLVTFLGPENVFVAVLESGSWDDSKGALRELDAQLAQLDVPRSIVLESTTHADEMSRTPNGTGWVWTSRGRQELRRVPYLANLRNRVMAEMAAESEAKGFRFDKVLWLNDVVFTTEDVLTLLSTYDGEYAAACSLDFSKPPAYYDTFALRDLAGSKTMSPVWPYFFPGASRRALVANEAVPVRSCWNGMVAMDTMPFYATPALKFRGIDDGLAELHLEGSECCIVHADNPLSKVLGVYINPNVRVGYNQRAYDTINAAPLWQSTTERIRAIWKLRLAFVLARLQSTTESMTVNRRLKQWGNPEPGRHCLINEMQVLVDNGWKHL